MDTLEQFFIGDIPVQRIDRRSFISWWANNNTFQHIVTINAEMIVESLKNKEFAELLKNNTFNIPDSISIVWAGHYLNKQFTNKWQALGYGVVSLLGIPFKQGAIHDVFPERLSGADIFWDIIGIAAVNKTPVYFLGAAEGVADQVAGIAIERVHNLKIAGSESGGDPFTSSKEIVTRINISNAEILLTAFGAPKQEEWIRAFSPYCPLLTHAIGLGGTFDFITGGKDVHGHTKAKRAPEFMREYGLEWLWRLITQPFRWKRIKRAIFDFPLYVFKLKMKQY